MLLLCKLYKPVYLMIESTYCRYIDPDSVCVYIINNAFSRGNVMTNGYITRTHDEWHITHPQKLTKLIWKTEVDII